MNQPSHAAEVRTPPAKAAGAAERLPAWHPAWARELADLYFSGTTCLFVLHGNVHDLVYCPGGRRRRLLRSGRVSQPRRSSAAGTWCLGYDLSQGLRPQAGADAERLPRHAAIPDLALGRSGRLAAGPRPGLAAAGRLHRAEPDRRCGHPQERRPVVRVCPIPAVRRAIWTPWPAGRARRLVRFLRSAQNPLIKQVNIAFCLIAESLAEVNERLVQSPHVATIEVPLPDREARCRFSRWATRGEELSPAGRFFARATGRHVQRPEPGQFERRALAGGQLRPPRR